MRPCPVRILSNLMVIIILGVVLIGVFLLASYAVDSTKALKSNLESCSADKDCCCGQFCIFYTNTKSFACQCKSDRWWNSALPYCRKFDHIGLLG